MATRKETLAFLFTDCEAMKDECNYDRKLGDLFDGADGGDPIFAMFLQPFSELISGMEACGLHLIGAFTGEFAGSLRELAISAAQSQGAEIVSEHEDGRESMACPLGFDQLCFMKECLATAVTMARYANMGDPDFENEAGWFARWTETGGANDSIKQGAGFLVTALSYDVPEN